MTQAEFGSRIGSVQNTVTGYESGRRNPSAPVISLICREFNICEDWLRNGEGEMFNPAPSDVLDQLANEYDLSNASYVAIEKFVNLKPEKRNELIGFFLEIAKALEESGSDPNAPAIPGSFVPGFSQDSLIQAFRDSAPKTPEEMERMFPPVGESDEDVG